MSTYSQPIYTVYFLLLKDNHILINKLAEPITECIIWSPNQIDLTTKYIQISNKVKNKRRYCIKIKLNEYYEAYIASGTFP